MELASARALFREARHPYTLSLLSAMPLPTRRRGRERIVLRGEVSPLGSGAQGCPFQPRCPLGRDREICRTVTPPLAPAGDGHLAACHFPGAMAA
jgi:oligopeptide/dipeptide ABC transporter ATP-binding protein